MSVYIYILMTYLSGIDQLKAIDQWEQRMIGHVIDIEKVKLVKNTVWTLVIKSPYLRYWLQRSRYVKSNRSDSCDWRCGRISRWAGFSEKHRTPVVRRTSFPLTVVGDHGWTHNVFMLKIASRWQSVNQWKSTTTATSSEDSGPKERIPSSWDNLYPTVGTVLIHSVKPELTE